MRLIDADKLKQELEVNGLGYQYYMLDNAPTVEAIPIEWIKEHYAYYGIIKTLVEEWEKENEKSSNRD